jgi:hypothetical protein
MTLLLQDVIVTLLSAGALALLVWRVVGVLTPASGSPACGSCSSCAPQPHTQTGGGLIVPVDALRRRGTRSGDARHQSAPARR